MTTASLLDLVLLVAVTEAATLVLLLRKRPDIERVGLIATLAAGLALMFATRAVARDATVGEVALWLLLALACHLTDLCSRFARRGNRRG